ncbi:unnamed protein product, partial [Musa acuminata subsp. burmannicoides]
TLHYEVAACPQTDTTFIATTKENSKCAKDSVGKQKAIVCMRRTHP